MGKQIGGTFDIGSSTEDYLATSVAFDSSGTASLLLGEVQVASGPDTFNVSMYPCMLNSGDTSPVLSNYIRSSSFMLMPGASVSAAIYLLSDSMSIAGIAHDLGRAQFSVDLIDSASGEVLVPMYSILLGG